MAVDWCLKRIDDLVRSPCFIARSIDNQRSKRSRVIPSIGKERISDEISLKDCGKLLKEMNYKWIESYKRQGLRSIHNRKANGKLMIKDRIVQDLYKCFLGTVIESTSDPNSFGFRKGRSAHHAIGAVKHMLIQKEKSKRSG